MANTYNICTKLQSIADALGDAQTSDLIDALADIAQAISQGGGGGTSDYTQLTNKPQINGYVLSGNQTSSQLGLQSALTFDNTPTSGSSNPVTSDGVYDAIDTLNSNISNLIKKDTYTGTTDANGNINTNIKTSDRMVIGAFAGGSNHDRIICWALSSSDPTWSFTLLTNGASLAVRSNETATITYYYVDAI